MGDGEAKRRMNNAAENRVKQTVSERAAVRKKAFENPSQPWLADDDCVRRQKFARRFARDDAEGMQGATYDFQPYAFLAEGTRVGRSVALVHATDGGSGFLITKRLLITNNHVVENVADAKKGFVQFNFELDSRNRPTEAVQFAFAPDDCFVTSGIDDLDYTIVALGPRISATDPTRPVTFGFCPLSDRDDKHAKGIPLNVIQHPRLEFKQIVLRNNLLVARLDHVLQYESDTDHGSSGSPVFNDFWEVVALHHWGSPHRDIQAGVQNVNEGVRISAIVDDVKRKLSGLSQPMRNLIEEALRLGEINSSAAATTDAIDEGAAPVISPGTGAPEGVVLQPVDRGAPMGNEATFTIPITITVTVGNTSAGRLVGDAPVTMPAVSVVAPPPVVVHDFGLDAEGVKTETNPQNRTGYNSTFLDEAIEVPMPRVAEARLAPLHDKTFELKYEHFSVKLHKTRRIAIYTATVSVRWTAPGSPS